MTQMTQMTQISRARGRRAKPGVWPRIRRPGSERDQDFWLGVSLGSGPPDSGQRPAAAPRAFRIAARCGISSASSVSSVAVVTLLLAFALMLPSAAQAPTAPVPRVESNRAIEERFVSGVSIESISTIHRQVTEHPHIAGSTRSMEVADRVRRALDAAGLQTEVREYSVYLSTPRSVKVDIVAPAAQSLTVVEPAQSCRRWRRASRTGSGVCRLLGVRHRDGAGCVRELRFTARLRAARRGRCRCARQDRDRSLRAQPSRGEDSHRGAGRRGRHHHLFRSGRRWVREGDDVARRAVARGFSVAERQRQIQLVLAWRSADAWRGRHTWRDRRSIRQPRRRCRRSRRWCFRGKRPRRSCRSSLAQWCRRDSRARCRSPIDWGPVR